ncbi:UDP-glucuronic acid decarboxylase 1-like [Dermatophagoides pteronyssinus]|uniref:UDP-glucuronate decarboxylase n=1 Tax=Dermatophagoides pteronyssinus TaxID=6956 RepID=A0A6P6YM24_DERPT|nr:UDP-glucuronic acid decarboxylase 1-like [Dermatophagoides pteronyssinus]
MTLPRIFYILFLFVFFTLTIIFTNYHNLSSSKQDDDDQQRERYKYEVINDNNNNFVVVNNQQQQQQQNNNTKLFMTIEKLQNEIEQLRSRLEMIESKNVVVVDDDQRNRHSDKSSSNRKYFQKTKSLPYSEKKRILITGGAGFVGSHLLDRLLFDGHEVIVADNFYTGRRSNIEHWFGHPNFELLHHDIVNPLYVEVDEIYHLASPASPPHYMMNAVKTIKTNTMGTINMLGLAKRVGARILVASTSEIYGDPSVHPQSESYWGNVNPIGPRSCYDEGKRVAEALTYAYAKQENLNVRVARIFNTYGPRMHANDGRVVSNFISQAIQHKPLTIYGNGNQTRSFQYISDLIEGLVRLMNSNYSQPINLGNPDELTIENLAKIILNLVHSDNQNDSKEQQPDNHHKYIDYQSAKQDDPRRRRPDINLANSILNWYPNITLIDGLSKTIDYFRFELKRSLGG